MRVRVMAGLAVVWSGCAGSCSAEAPPEFDRFRADLQADTPVRMTLSWPDPVRPIDHPVQVTIGPEGASAKATMGSVTTDGSTVKLEDAEFQVPLPDLADEAQELFAELRSGLSSSVWTTVDAPLYGPTRLAANAAWAKVDLPFDWMASEHLLLAVDRDSGALRMVLVETTDPPLEVSSKPLRGGPRTVRLSAGDQLKLVVQDYRR